MIAGVPQNRVAWCSACSLLLEILKLMPGLIIPSGRPHLERVDLVINIATTMKRSKRLAPCMAMKPEVSLVVILDVWKSMIAGGSEEFRGFVRWK